MMRVATCACDQLSVACEDEPVLVSLCHCLECQKRTGSTFGIAAFFVRDRVTVTGEASIHERPSDSGHPVSHHFCASCGSAVFRYPHRKLDYVAIAAGAFADPNFPGPQKSAYAERRHGWLPESL